MLKRILVFSLLIIHVMFSGVVFAAATEALTLDDCIRTALDGHPDMVAAASRIDSRKAAVGQAASGARTQVTAEVGYTRSDNSVINDNSGSYNTNVKASQILFDWGRNGLQIKGAKTEMDATTADYLATRDTVIANVRSAYYGLNLSVRQQEVAQVRLNNYTQRLDWAKTYYNVGTKARIEVTKAEADVANSRLNLVKAQSSIEQYRAQLASAMGIPLQRIDQVQDVLDFEEWDISVDDAVSRAMEGRPELLAQQRRVDYAKTNLQLQMKGNSPTISASAGYNLYGSAPVDENGWSTSVSLSVPIFDGGLNKSKVEGAQADLATATAQYDGLINSAMLEVRRAWESLREAKQSLQASMESERFAKETLELAQGRYRSGVGDSLEISDAVESYSSSQTNTILSLHDCKYAQLNLEKAMGGL